VTGIPLFRFRFDGQTALGAIPGVSDEKQMYFYVDDSPIANLLGAVLNPLHADLVDVAAAVHIADRLAKRPVKTEVWQRRFVIEVPVRSRDVWQRRSVSDSLTDLLNFLTGDDWTIRFSSRHSERRPAELQGVLFTPPDDAPVSVGLFSGGLDAFAGTVSAISQDADQHFVCVSGTPNRRQEHHQREQVAALRDGLKPRSITSIRVPCWLRSADETIQERSRRTRGFLFLALGTVAAIAVGTRRLSVYENGIGAINLSYERVPAGIPNSRAVHPRSLLLYSNLVQALTDEHFVTDNPCTFQTKTEMCQHPSVQNLRTVVSQTFSCDGFPVHRARKPQCGVCTSCLLRRLALFGADMGQVDQATYGCDLLNPGTVPASRLRGLFAMDWQVGRIERNLGNSSPWPNLLVEFPELRDACDAFSTLKRESLDAIQAKIIRLYSKHCVEWACFPARSRLHIQRKVA